MPTIAQRLNAMTINATSPDNQIRATLVGRSNISVEFRPNTYQYYAERTMEHQLGRLATLTWTGYRRGYDKVITEAGLEVVADAADEWDNRRREYQKVRTSTIGKGKSIKDKVRVKTMALLNWNVWIQDGTIGELSETEFIRETLSAVSVAIKDYRRNSAALRAEYFGTGLDFFGRPEDRPQAA